MRNHFHSTTVGLQVVHKSVHFLGGQCCEMVRSRDRHVCVCVYTCSQATESVACVSELFAELCIAFDRVMRTLSINSVEIRTEQWM